MDAIIVRAQTVRVQGTSGFIFVAALVVRRAAGFVSHGLARSGIAFVLFQDEGAISR